MDIQLLFESPDYFLLGFEGDSAIFVEMDRDAYHRSIFFDRRIQAKGQPIRTPLAPLLAHEARHRHVLKLGYIFHIAHCGSTLLARALDAPASNLVVREPPALRQLGVQASERFGSVHPEDWHRRLMLVARLLHRRYNPAGPVIVKGNVPINFLAHELMALETDQPAILLYFSLEHYLWAVLPDHARWVETVGRELEGGIQALTGPALAGEPIAVVVARLWLAQMLIYEGLLARHPSVVSLDAEAFFDAPREVLAAAFAQFGQVCAPQAIDEIVRGEMFATYSKKPDRAFDNGARLARRRAAAGVMKPAIEQARDWIRASGLRVPETLAKPLIGQSPLLLG